MSHGRAKSKREPADFGRHTKCWKPFSVRTNERQPAVPSSTHYAQSKIIGILWMVPIYAVDSFVSLRFKDAALYVDMLRDCYEGYALYLFLALMVGYLGDGDEYKVSYHTLLNDRC